MDAVVPITVSACVLRVWFEGLFSSSDAAGSQLHAGRIQPNPFASFSFRAWVLAA